jgi:hypothetical protein
MKRKRKGMGLLDALDMFSLCVVGLLFPFQIEKLIEMVLKALLTPYFVS